MDGQTIKIKSDADVRWSKLLHLISTRWIEIMIKSMIKYWIYDTKRQNRKVCMKKKERLRN